MEVPYLLAQAVLFSVISYWMVHFEADPGQAIHPHDLQRRIAFHCEFSCCVMLLGPVLGREVVSLQT